jgi:hypothetical protein
MRSQGLKIGDDIVQFVVGDDTFRKGRHGADTLPHLKLHEKARERFIINGWSQPCIPARMTLMTLPHEYPLSTLESIIERQGTEKQLAAPARSASLGDDRH